MPRIHEALCQLTMEERTRALAWLLVTLQGDVTDVCQKVLRLRGGTGR